MLTHGSLFSGIGGFDLAAQWAGWENIFQVEIDPWCQRILAKNFPYVTRHTDIRNFDPAPWCHTIDVLSGGFPCQGFSLAGKRLGTNDHRYLWPQMREVIGHIKPTWVLGENVTGITSMEDRSGTYRDIFPVMENRTIVRYDTIDHYEAIYTRQAKMLIATICEDLEEEGYQVQPLAVPAAGVGAPHKRERIWFIAHRQSQQMGTTRQPRQHPGMGDATDTQDIGRQRGRDTRRWGNGFEDGGPPHPHPNRQRQQQPERTIGEKRRRPEHLGQKDVAHPDCSGLERRENQEAGQIPTYRDNWSEWTTEPPVCRMDDGIPNRVDRIRGLGNAIVPQLSWRIFDTINQYEALHYENK